MTEARGRTGGLPARHQASPASRVLVVEDEPALLRALRINLRARGYEVATATAGRQALAEARQRPPDVVVLDLGLPDLDGIEVIRDLRTWSRAPVIVLSGRAGSEDKIGALDAGADDYVTKPFDMEELLARLRAALRRDDRAPEGARFTIGRCEIDLTAHTIVRHRRPEAAGVGPSPPGPELPSAVASAAVSSTTVSSTTVSSTTGPATTGPERLHLTPTEWRLLEILLNAPGQLVGSDRLLGEVWGPGFERSTHYLRFHMAGLRRKLEDDPHRPRHLLTEPGMGYRYQP
jgi:two-component system KDP operon response regulator KdpE